MRTIQKMFDHQYWGNQCILEKVNNLDGENREILRLFSHILLAEKVWITRLEGLDSSGIPIWVEGNLDSCVELVRQNKESYTAFLSHLSEEKLDDIITYTNSKGTTLKNSIRDILTHVALHGHYHRGQINARIRANGMEPLCIDFITFVR